MFGVSYQRLDMNIDKAVLFTYILESFKLDVFIKQIEEDNYDMYSENPISSVGIECGGYYR